MEWFVRMFIKASLAWLGAGVVLGVAMAVHPAYIIYRPAHVHMNLLGFVTMMIFGVAYHVIPRFTGHPLHTRRLARWHWYVSNAGLVLMVAGFAIRANGGLTASIITLSVGGVLSATGAFFFIYNLWRTIDGPSTLRRAAASQAAAPQQRRMPTIGA